MKKYSTPAYIDGENGETVFGSVDVYLASEVDGLLQMKQERIAELEKFVSEFLFYFSSSNGIPVEQATIKADSDIVRIARSL